MVAQSIQTSRARGFNSMPPTEITDSIATGRLAVRRRRPVLAQEFVRSQGLRNIVIRARVKAGYPVGLIVAGRQHNHRYHGSLAQPLQNMKSIQNRQHHVQQNQIVRALNGIG